MRIATLISVVGLMVAFAPNSVSAQADKPMSMAPAIIGSTWTATEINGDAAPTDRSTFQINEEMKAVGNGACNSWFAPIVIEGDKLQLGPIASTRKACRGTMEQEAAYFAALAATRTWQAAEGELRFLDGDANVVLRFRV